MIQRKRLLEKIDRLGSTEHAEVLRIVKAHGVSVTENKNGVFFNLTTLKPDTFQVVEEFVNYCYDNKIELDKYDQKLHECKYFNKNPSFASAYGVNEPKNRRQDGSVIPKFDRMDKSKKMSEFARKLCAPSSAAEAAMRDAALAGGAHAAAVVKRGSSKFTMCKKKFMKQRSQDNDQSMPDVLELDKKS